MADNTTLNTGSGGDVIATDDVTTMNFSASSGVKVQRVKIMYGQDGDANDVNFAAPLPVQENPNYWVPTPVTFWASDVTAGTSGTEALVTLTRATNDGAAVTTGTSFVPPDQEVDEVLFRITSITVSLRGHSTATAAKLIATLRIHTAGAITTTSPAVVVMRCGTPGTSLAWDRATINFPEGLPIYGDGTLTFGMTVRPTFTTNAPTYDILITGHEK